MRLSLKDRLIENRLMVNDCWRWVGTINSYGYGTLGYNGTTHRVNRLSAHVFLGFDLNTKLPICHKPLICKYKDCFNPDHLYVGTNSLNERDKVIAGTHHETRKTHCPQGHEYSKENTLVDVYRTRRCRTCRREYLKRLQRKKDNDILNKIQSTST